MIEAEFNGVMKDTAPHKIPPGFFLEDQGGDRYFRGVWRRRRGMLHSNLSALSGVPQTILSFETPGEDFAMLIVSGADVHGFTNVTEQTF